MAMLSSKKYVQFQKIQRDGWPCFALLIRNTFGSPKSSTAHQKFTSRNKYPSLALGALQVAQKRQAAWRAKNEAISK